MIGRCCYSEQKVHDPIKCVAVINNKNRQDSKEKNILDRIQAGQYSLIKFEELTRIDGNGQNFITRLENKCKDKNEVIKHLKVLFKVINGLEEFVKENLQLNQSLIKLTGSQNWSINEEKKKYIQSLLQRFIDFKPNAFLTRDFLNQSLSVFIIPNPFNLQSPVIDLQSPESFLMEIANIKDPVAGKKGNVFSFLYREFDDEFTLRVLKKLDEEIKAMKPKGDSVKRLFTNQLKDHLHTYQPKLESVNKEDSGETVYPHKKYSYVTETVAIAEESLDLAKRFSINEEYKIMSLEITDIDGSSPHAEVYMVEDGKWGKKT